MTLNNPLFSLFVRVFWHNTFFRVTQQQFDHSFNYSYNLKKNRNDQSWLLHKQFSTILQYFSTFLILYLLIGMKLCPRISYVKRCHFASSVFRGFQQRLIIQSGHGNFRKYVFSQNTCFFLNIFEILDIAYFAPDFKAKEKVVIFNLNYCQKEFQKSFSDAKSNLR